MISRNVMYNKIIREYNMYSLGLVDSKQMMVLLNILEACGEEFEAAIGDCCSYVFTLGARTRLEAAEWLLRCNRFWVSKEQFIESIISDGNVLTHDELQEWSNDLVETSDGYVETHIY